MPATPYRVAVNPEETYPRVLSAHPRNRGIDWKRLTEYGRGEVAEYEADIFIKTNIDLGAVRLGQRLFAGPTALVSAFREGGAQILARPVGVNGEEYWTIHCPVEIEALDLVASRVEYVGPSQLPEVMGEYVWLSHALRVPLFRIPQTYDVLWASGEVVDRVTASGVPGLGFMMFGTMSADSQ
jgi:hypothetical protein